MSDACRVRSTRWGPGSSTQAPARRVVSRHWSRRPGRRYPAEDDRRCVDVIFDRWGKAGRTAELRLESGKLALMRVYRVETSKGDVPEGISVDAEGRVWVCTDGEGMLRQLELGPGS